MTATIVLPLVLAGVIAAPAVAKSATYVGPILGPPKQVRASSVEFAVGTKGKKLRPVTISKFRFYFLISSCQDSEGPLELQSSTALGSPQKRLKRGRFTYSLSSDGVKYTVSGRVPRKGPAEGTIEVTGSYPVPDTGPVFCDSTSRWTAKKVS